MVRVSWAVEERVSALLLLGGEFNGLREGDPGRRDLEGLCLAQHFHATGLQVGACDLRRRVRPGSHEPQALHAVADQVRRGERRVPNVQRMNTGLSDANQAQAIDALLGVDARDAPVRKKCIPGKSEYPLWNSEVGIRRGKSSHVAPVRLVQVPPTAAIGDEVKFAVRAPLRLKHRLLRPAGHTHRVLQSAAGYEVRTPELATVPGHSRMVPGKPGELVAIGARARGGIEIAA